MLKDNTLMSIISEIQQKTDFQATIKAFNALFMDFNCPWQAGHAVHYIANSIGKDVSRLREIFENKNKTKD